MKGRDARSLPAVAQEDLRQRAVRAVVRGRSQTEVAALFGVTRQAVGKWVKAYRADGEAALKARPKGRPRGGRLKPWQAAQIAKAVVQRPPDQLQLPFYLWTREAVAQLIERRFGMRLSRWTVGRYLQRWGFTPQQPARRAFERNPEQVRRWLEQDYPAIRRQARAESAEIYWADEMGLRSDHAVGTSYAPRGQTPVIPTTGQRFGASMISAITNRGRLHFMVFRERFRVPVLLDFLRRLVRQAQRKVFLILDRHPVHRSTKAKQWLHEHAQHLRLFYLPGYSPELNPDEMLNQDVKTNAVGRRRPRNQPELLSQLRSYLHRRQRQPHIVRRYFQAETVRYAAA